MDGGIIIRDICRQGVYLLSAENECRSELLMKDYWKEQHAKAKK